MRRIIPLLSLLLSASLLLAVPPVRKFPEGTRLRNDMVTPIYVERLDPAGEGDVMHLRLKDASGYRLDVYAQRTIEFDLRGDAQKVLRLFLHQAPGKTGATAIAEKSSEERAHLQALESALEHYAPGWTDNWTMEGHRELRQLILDLHARQDAR